MEPPLVAGYYEGFVVVLRVIGALAIVYVTLSLSALVFMYKSANYACIVIVYTRARVISQLNLRARIIITVYTSTRAHHKPTRGMH